jgi:hypothetical protein
MIDRTTRLRDDPSLPARLPAVQCPQTAKDLSARMVPEEGDRALAIARGDCGCGNGAIIDVCEPPGLPYLLRWRKTVNVKRRIERPFIREEWTRVTESSQGLQAIEDELCLSGWSRARQVVVLRRRIRNDIALTASKRGKNEQHPLVPALAHGDVQDNAQIWEYTVRVTNARYDIAAIGQLYRDRCDCENGFDELKNRERLAVPS